MDPVTILSLCAFGFVASLTFFGWTMLKGDNEARLRSRLQSNLNSTQGARFSTEAGEQILTRMTQAVSRPFMPTQREKISSTRRSLGKAGIYSPSAVRTLYGLKFIFLFVGVIAGNALGAAIGSPMMCLPMGALLGFFAPVIWLRRKIKFNQKALDRGLPDALDLMVVCVEAGLTMDAAMQRVGQELAAVHPAISRELGITHMETRIGMTRVEAMRNLGIRTGSVALQSLGAILIQADRFGTSIAQALRVHAESLRIRRQNMAEELAARSSVKMSFPLVFFIFPATFLVLAGPTVIRLMHSPLFR